MKSETIFRVFFLKQHRKNSLKNIFFPSESVFLNFSFWPQGHRTTQNAHCALYSTQCNWNKHELEASHEKMRRGIRDILEFLLVGLMLLCNYLAAVSGSGHRDICRTQHPLFQTTFYKIEDCIADNVQIIFYTTF